MEYTTGAGVKLELKKPNGWAITAVTRQMVASKPEPPMVWIADKERDEPNEADPNYLAAVRLHEAAMVERMWEAAVATGVTILAVPDGTPALDSEEWLEVVQSLGLPVPERPTERKLLWVKFVACESMQDAGALLRELMGLLGTREEDVAEAVAAFRGNEKRGANPEPAGNGRHPDGNRVRQPPRGTGATVRGAGSRQIRAV